MRPSQNPTLPPRIHSPFQKLLYVCICDPPKIYPSLPEYTPLFNNYYMYVNATLPKSTPPSQNNLLFNNHMRPYQNLFLPSRINSSFQQLLYMRPSHKLPLLPRIHHPPPLSTTIYNTPRIYPYLTEYTPPLFNNYMQHSQNIPPFSTSLYARPSQKLPFPLRKYPHFSTTLCDPPRIHPSLLPEYISPPPFQQLYATLTEYTPPSHNITSFKQLYATLPESTPPFQNTPPFQQPHATLP